MTHAAVVYAKDLDRMVAFYTFLAFPWTSPRAEITRH
jgi:hypothetical protein